MRRPATLRGNRDERDRANEVAIAAAARLRTGSNPLSARRLRESDTAKSSGVSKVAATDRQILTLASGRSRRAAPRARRAR